jgi:hypothetical protein
VSLGTLGQELEPEDKVALPRSQSIESQGSHGFEEQLRFKLSLFLLADGERRRLPEHASRIYVQKGSAAGAKLIEISGTPGETAEGILRSSAGLYLTVNIVREYDRQNLRLARL